jgi:hypothetical protein
MKTTLIIRHKHLYRIWFIHFVRYLGANPDTIDKTLKQISQNEERYFKNLFKVGNIKPRKGVTTRSKVFEAHLDGIKTVGNQLKYFTGKFPQLATFELNDPSWIRIVTDWAEVLAGQAAASCNTQAEDDGGGLDDPERCVDAWLAYDEAVIAYGMAQDNLDDCRFQNSNPPLDTAPEDEGPFGGDGDEIDPCLTQAMDLILAENNMNAAWEDINRYC